MRLRFWCPGGRQNHRNFAVGSHGWSGVWRTHHDHEIEFVDLGAFLIPNKLGFDFRLRNRCWDEYNAEKRTENSFGMLSDCRYYYILN